MTRRLFVIGGTGFIGAETVREAVAQGWEVRALARSEEAAARLSALGAIPVRGDARAPADWIGAARGCDALVDLAQPELPARISAAQIEEVSRARQGMSRELLRVLAGLAPEERPLLVSVSGTDDLAPDAERRIDGSSKLRTSPTGFGRIGVPVRHLVERSGMGSTFLVLGTVYGPGKSFAATIFPRIARRRMLLPAPAANRLPLIHVRDAGRAIVHLLGLGTRRLLGRSWMLVDEAGGARLGEFFDRAAAIIGVDPPARAPAWLLSKLMGKAVFETMTRDLEAAPSDLLATGFRFAYPTIREGLPATLSALGYASSPKPASPPRHHWRSRLLFAVTLGALVAVNAPVLPLGVPALRRLAAGDTILDMRFGYSAATAYHLLEALGPVGRARYLEMLWTIDLAMPALFSLLLWRAVSRGALARWRSATLAAGAADYLENLAVTALLVAYPGRHDVLVALASALTIAKFTLYAAGLALAAFGAWLAHRSRRSDAG